MVLLLSCGANEEARDADWRVAGLVPCVRFFALRERHFETDAGIVDPWCDLAAIALLEVHDAVPLHCLKRAREVGLSTSRRLGQLRQRSRVRLGDQREQRLILSRQHLCERLRRRKPDFRLVGRRLEFAPRDCHRPRLELLHRGNPDFQDVFVSHRSRSFPSSLFRLRSKSLQATSRHPCNRKTGCARRRACGRTRFAFWHPGLNPPGSDARYRIPTGEYPFRHAALANTSTRAGAPVLRRSALLQISPNSTRCRRRCTSRRPARAECPGSRLDLSWDVCYHLMTTNARNAPVPGKNRACARP